MSSANKLECTHSSIRCRLVSHREGLVPKSGKDKKDSLAKKKQEQTQVTQRESIAFSILYNNALFLFGVIVLGFFVFKSASAPLYAPPPPRFSSRLRCLISFSS